MPPAVTPSWIICSARVSAAVSTGVTPNSFDTGGILDDSLNVRQDKMALVKRLWGMP
jgi:hypothetical protein